MEFNKHYDLEGKHALLSASTWRWLNDDEESLARRLTSQYATQIGTILHEVAYKHIKYRIKLAKHDKKTVMLELLSNGIPGFIMDYLDFDAMFDNLMAYVNDGVGFKMTPEVVLKFSNNFFGTTDAINYNETKHFLRIHDYKSGTTKVHMEQLLIYAALFSLEYRLKPNQFDTELRIYQNNEVICHNPAPDEIAQVANTIITLENHIIKLDKGV